MPALAVISQSLAEAAIPDPRASNKSRFRLVKSQIASSTMTTFASALLHDSNAEPE
jgi:hypothetical protein